MSEWAYTIQIGHADYPVDTVVGQVLDETGTSVFITSGDDIPTVLTRIAEAILSVEDPA